MERYEYQVTRHEAEEFRQVVYFCSDRGDCGLEEVPAEQAQRLVDLLNERGEEGWELLQLAFKTDGFLGIWKRKIETAGAGT